MYQLNLLSDQPTQDVGRLIALTACAGFFGMGMLPTSVLTRQTSFLRHIFCDSIAQILYHSPEVDFPYTGGYVSSLFYPKVAL